MYSLPMRVAMINRFHIATFIALLFHVSGFIGLFSQRAQWFVANTPLNLLLMFALLLWTHPGKTSNFFKFLFIAFATGMLVEIIGVNTRLLFGAYTYGKVLGAGMFNVPFLIGINWFTVMYCCGIFTQRVHDWIGEKYVEAGLALPPKVQVFSFVIDGALLATFFDFILEPVAVRLGYWTWLGDGIPFYNYLCWFLVSVLLQYVFRALRLSVRNQFAIHLLLIELLFFGALRTFL